MEDAGLCGEFQQPGRLFQRLTRLHCDCSANVKVMHKLFELRGKKVAAVALARKLAGILFAIWRDGTVYDPHNASRPVLGPAAA